MKLGAFSTCLYLNSSKWPFQREMFNIFKITFYTTIDSENENVENMTKRPISTF